jgi:hypothetical protein
VKALVKVLQGHLPTIFSHQYYNALIRYDTRTVPLAHTDIPSTDQKVNFRVSCSFFPMLAKYLASVVNLVASSTGAC